MQLTTLIVVLCATCTAITVAPEQHPKPQLQQGTKASKALALRGGVAAAKLETTSSITWIKRFLEFRKLFRATDGLIMVFLWSFPYVLAAIPWHVINVVFDKSFPPINEWVQKYFFETVYLKEDAELAYIRWEVRGGAITEYHTLYTSISHICSKPYSPSRHFQSSRSCLSWVLLQTPLSSCSPSTRTSAFAGAPPSGGPPSLSPS
jgi:hypothetical protein